MGRHELTDAQCERLAPLLLPRWSGWRGRPYHDHLRIINGMFGIAKTEAPWRDLPTCYGPWQTVTTRLYRWQGSGLWARILAELQRQADRRGELNWEQRYVDRTIVRAHQHAAGARRSTGGQEQQAPGRSRGKFSTKLHLRAKGGGKPLTFLVTAGERHEQSVFEPIMQQGVARRVGRWRPQSRPWRIVGNKGYSSRKVRHYLRPTWHPRRDPEPRQRVAAAHLQS